MTDHPTTNVHRPRRFRVECPWCSMHGQLLEPIAGVTWFHVEPLGGKPCQTDFPTILEELDR